MPAGSRTPFDGIIISHLGNINGRQPERENKLSYVEKALKAGWHVCVDVVFHHGTFILPYDGGFNAVPPAFLSKQRVWCRAYDPATLNALCDVNATLFFLRMAWPSPATNLSGRWPPTT